MDLLILLVERRDCLISRAEIVERLWGEGVFVDVETGINTAIRKLRQALNDSTEAPHFVETVPGKGYRFTAKVEVMGGTVIAEAPVPITLAVLPFENLGGGAEREPLGDGLTEETIASLGQIAPEYFRVIGRTTMMTYKRTHKTLATIGSELNATYLIEGSLRAEHGRLRITAKLIRSRDQTQVWAASYDSEPSSMLAFQRELSITIAEQIRLRLSPERLMTLERRQTQNAEAYDLYLHGRHFWNQNTPPTTRRAIEYFARACDLDSNYALAWAGLADAYAGSPISGDTAPLTVTPLAQDAVTHALNADPELAEVQTSLGFLKFWLHWDWIVAERAYRKAISLDPNYPLSHRMLGIVLSHMGRHEEARTAMQRARELDPRYAMHQALSSQVAFAAREYSAAAAFAKQAIIVNPEHWIGHFQLAQVQVQLGNTDLALDALNNAGRLSGGNTKSIALRGYLFAKMARFNDALEVLNTLEAISRERYVPPYAMALVHAGLEQHDSALHCLERAYDARDVHMVFLPIDTKWDPFRKEARFVTLLNRCRFATENWGSSHSQPRIYARWAAPIPAASRSLSRNVHVLSKPPTGPGIAS